MKMKLNVTALQKMKMTKITSYLELTPDQTTQFQEITDGLSKLDTLTPAQSIQLGIKMDQAPLTVLEAVHESMIQSE